MKQLSCRSMGEDCDFVAKGQDEDEIAKKAIDHVKSDHPDKWAEIQQMSNEEKDKMMEEMGNKITEA
jgi:predicted small metal-binding protein